jgi:hypothetical protein
MTFHLAKRFVSARSSAWPRSPALCLLALLSLLALASCGRLKVSAASSKAQSGNTDIEITTKVHLQGVRRFGINIGGQNFYDSGQMLRNLVFRNPGFEGEAWRSILRCKVATVSSCTDENQYSVWPAKFLQGARFEFLTGPAAGLSGTILSSSGSSASGPESGVSFSFPPLPKLPVAGDFVIVSFELPGEADKGWWTNTLQTGSAFATETRDLSPNSPGKQALRIQASGAGQSARLDSYFDTFDGRSFLTLKGRYTLSFRAKGAGGNNLLTFGILRTDQKSGNEVLLPARALHLTGSWKDYSFDWNADEDGTRIGHVDLSFAVSGADVLLDDVCLVAAAASDNPTAFRNEVVATLRDLKPGILRYNDVLTDAASTLDNLIAPPLARVRAGYSTQATSQEQIPLGLQEVLVLSRAVHAEPWYALPATMTPDDVKRLIEYLAGPPNSPYGAKRAALGQVEPWTHVFPILHLEFGNELWNRNTFYGAAMSDPAAYGRRAAQLFAAARSSPSFTADKFDLVLGSQAVNPWWTSQELVNSGQYDSVAVAPYLFDALVDASSPEAIFGPMLAEPQMVDSRSSGYMAGQAKAARDAPKSARLEVYEVNLGTDQGQAPQASVDSAATSLGSALSVMEHMLLMLRDLDANAQSVYSLTGYVNKFRNPGNSNEHTPLWGNVIDMGGPTNRRRPLFLAEKMVNEAIGSSMLETRLSGADPIWTQPHSRNNDIELANAHVLQAFAFAEGRQQSLIVFNLDRQNAHTITLSGHGSPTGQIAVSQLRSSAITDTNEQSDLVHVVRAVLPKLDAQTPYALPPFSMTVLEWKSAH